MRSKNKVIPRNDLSEYSRDAFLSKYKKRKLRSASLSEDVFWMLIEISPVHSEKVICALHDFLVFGYTRREVCEKYNVSLSYFSIVLGRVSHVNQIVSSLASHYEGKHYSTGLQI